MPMIGGEQAELADGGSGSLAPGVRRQVDEVFASLFACARRPPELAADADDRMRVAPAQPIPGPADAPAVHSPEPARVPALAGH